MSWVTIDQEKCNHCGMCARRCTRCFTNNDGVISVQADEECCVLCGHCVALCRTSAITHHRMDMNNFPPISDEIPLDPDEFLQFVRQRRSHRGFKKKSVPREDLNKLVEICRYCPTGSNLQTVQIKIITNQKKMQKLSDLTVDYFMKMINQVEKKIKKIVSKGGKITEDLALQKEIAVRYQRLGLAKELGIDPILHRAPAVMIFHSPPNPSTPKDDCVIAAQTVVLAAMTMGLGTCYIGLFTKAACNYPLIPKALDLPQGNEVHSVLVIGYPSLKYVRAVDRKPMAVQWEE